MAISSSAEKPLVRLAGVDSLRFWLALWVYFSHFGLLPFTLWIGKNTVPRLFLSGLTANLFNGAGAVIGFFLISGLCIHYPYQSMRLELLPFYTRRYLRILIPLGAALTLSRFLNNDLPDFYRAILWSLIAEEIYYAIYPALRIAFAKVGVKVVLAGSYVIAFGIIAVRPHALNFHEFGPALTWAVGLPAWLLGCCLAEAVWKSELATIPVSRIWLWRLLVWGLGSMASGLRFHAGIGYPVTLTLLGPVLYCWLRAELTKKNRMRAFEFGGKFSYSIYLMHGLAVSLLGLALPLLDAESAVRSIVRLLVMLLVSYGFFLIVEQPSHRLARNVARSILYRADRRCLWIDRWRIRQGS